MTFARHRKPSAVRRRQDEELIIKLIYASEFAEYRDDMNPFTDAEPVRKERFERLYKRYRKTAMDLDFRFRELSDVYGTEFKRKVG